MVIGHRLLGTPSVVGCHARKCEVPSGEIGWRGSRSSSWQEERGGAGEDGEESPLAGKIYWQKPLPKGRLSSTVMLSLKLFNFATLTY